MPAAVLAENVKGVPYEVRRGAPVSNPCGTVNNPWQHGSQYRHSNPAGCNHICNQGYLVRPDVEYRPHYLRALVAKDTYARSLVLGVGVEFNIPVPPAKMRLLVTAALAFGVASQVFEADDFDVTEALIA